MGPKERLGWRLSEEGCYPWFFRHGANGGNLQELAIVRPLLSYRRYLIASTAILIINGLFYLPLNIYPQSLLFRFI